MKKTLCGDTGPESVLLAVDRLELSKDFRHAPEDRLVYQQERESAFLERPDSFAIYQLDNSCPSSLRFISYDEMVNPGVYPENGVHDLIWNSILTTPGMLPLSWISLFSFSKTTGVTPLWATQKPREDAGGLSPAKDDDEVWREQTRKTLMNSIKEEYQYKTELGLA